MHRGMTCPRYKVFSVMFAVMTFVIWLSAYLNINQLTTISDNSIFIASWIGIIICILYLIVWKRITGKYFTLLNIFLAFFAVFNFGQCFLWAFGIHTDLDIGRRLVFSSVMADSMVIFKAQMLFIICYIFFNTGAICSWKDTDVEKSIVLLRDRNITNDTRYNILYMSSKILAIYAVPTTIIRAIIKTVFSQMYSYHDLYYGTVATSSLMSNLFLIIGSQLFFPSLIGLLIGSGYKKNVRMRVYFYFLIYAMLTLICGDRGEWIKPFLILLWAEWNLCKKVDTKKVIFGAIIGFVGLYIMNAIVDLRNTGLSWDGFVANLTSAESNVIISTLLEFGHSMGIAIILLKNHVVCPYGNTYLMTIPTIFGTGLANGIFRMNYVQLHTWFPLEYLQISYGTDFTIIGEALLNFGVYLTPIILLIEGFFISKVAEIPNKVNSDPYKLMLSLTCMSSLIKLPRSTVWLTFNEIAYVFVIFGIVHLIVKSYYANRV